jgi:hypothetical protein
VTGDSARNFTWLGISRFGLKVGRLFREQDIRMGSIPSASTRRPFRFLRVRSQAWRYLAQHERICRTVHLGVISRLHRDCAWVRSPGPVLPLYSSPVEHAPDKRTVLVRFQIGGLKTGRSICVLNYNDEVRVRFPGATPLMWPWRKGSARKTASHFLSVYFFVHEKYRNSRPRRGVHTHR